MLIDDRHPCRSRRKSSKAVVFGAVLGLLGFAIIGQVPSAAEAPRLVPAALVDVPSEDGLQTAVLAGGCFWGIQGVFQHVEGVVSATSGYAGGSAETATYEQTETGLTGHAEAVRVVFDPQKISYGTLLRIFFSATQDILPWMGAWRQMPKVDGEFNKDFQREEYVTTARYGLKTYRRENFLTVLSDPSIVA